MRPGSCRPDRDQRCAKVLAVDPDARDRPVIASTDTLEADLAPIDQIAQALGGSAPARYFQATMRLIRMRLWRVYLSRYTHRVAISNSRLLRFDQTGVTFRYKDYRRAGADRQQVMTLTADEFIRRFLLHVLPKGFHRIRHYGLLAGATRKVVLNHVRQLLGVALPVTADVQAEPDDVRPPCPCCGGHMVVIETFERQRERRAPPALAPPSGKQAS